MIPEDTSYIDISPILSPKLAVFPGDTPFRRDVALSFASGNHLALSSVTTTLHAGAHADAPSHYHKDGVGIDSVPLTPYLGRCQVVDLTMVAAERLLPEDVVPKLAAGVRRVLLRTDSFIEATQWREDFVALAPSVVTALAQRGIILIGIDTPSIDPAPAKELLAHQAVFRHGLAILEGLQLQGVTAGLYDLIALPLRIAGGDASPVRAILLPASI